MSSDGLSVTNQRGVFQAIVKPDVGKGAIVIAPILSTSGETDKMQRLAPQAGP
jgi:hypothetical protein